LADVQFEGIDQRENGNDGKNPHRNAKKRQQCPEQIGPQCSKSKGCAFKEEDEYLFQPVEKKSNLHRLVSQSQHWRKKNRNPFLKGMI
jgi:hypothetical protein